MASEQYPSDLSSGTAQMPEENSKPSFMTKVKAKAKKLKCKIKHHGSAEDSHDGAPTSGDPHAYTTRSADEGEDESDTYESDDEGNGNKYDVPYTPLSNAVSPRSQSPAGATDPKSEGTPFGSVTSGQSGYDADSTRTDGRSLPVDPSVLKADGPAGTQQAVPTNYSYFNSDPAKGILPSDASPRQRDVPSTIGGESAGLTAATRSSSDRTENPFARKDDALSRSGDRDSELPRSFMTSQDPAQKNDMGWVEPSQPSQESLLSQPIEQDQGFTDKKSDHHRGYEGLGVAAATAAGVGGVAAGADRKFGHSNGGDDGSFNSASRISKQKDLQKSLSNDGASEGGSAGVRSTSDPGFHDRSYRESEGEAFAPDTSGTAAGAKHAMDTNLNVPSEDSTWTQKVYNAVVGTKDTATANVDGSTDSPTAPTSTSPVDSQQKPITSRIADSAYGITNSLASTLGYGGNSASQTKDSAASNLSANDSEQKPTTDRVTESANGLKDSAASKLGYADEAMSTDSTPVSQKTTDSAVQAKDSAADNLSTNDGEQRPLMNRVRDTAYGLKDTAASKLGYADQAMSTDSTPVSQKATNYAVQGKNYAANQLGYADQALSSDEKPVSTKGYEAASQAGDGLVQKTTPDHHDKSLAGSVTESITSLPGMLTSKLGLGGGSTTTSPTTTAAQPGTVPTSTTPSSDLTSDSSTRKDTPYPDHPGATTPGLFDRVSGIASSLFGGGAKHPATPTEGEKSSSAEEYMP